jgi:NAD(P)-dependent dehydrogenase (short-subunit alcohol dehydrogenase family)
MRRALVTGVRRIGGVVARTLAARGADVALACHSSCTDAEATAAGVRALGRKAVVLSADLASADACRRLVDEAAAALGGLSTLVHAASRFDKIPLARLDLADWDRALAVDLSAAFHCAQAALPHLRRAGGGHIVLFSDWVAASGRPRYRGYLPYFVAKRSLVALGEALALEMAREGVRVHVVAPGPIVPAAGTSEAEARAVVAATPVGRWGGEEEVAERVADLVDTTFVTGDTLRIDGGRHLL